VREKKTWACFDESDASTSRRGRLGFRELAFFLTSGWEGAFVLGNSFFIFFRVSQVFVGWSICYRSIRRIQGPPKCTRKKEKMKFIKNS
jgi:hypothetical protein